MSDGAHPMRDGRDAPALWAPEWQGVDKPLARYALLMLREWADGRGALPPATMEEMAERMDIGVSSLRDYMRILIREGFVSRPMQGRLPDGKMSPLVHWLNLEKLGNAANHRQNSAPVEPGAEGVDKPVEEPPPELSAGAETGAEIRPAGAEFQQPPPELSAGENGGVITTGARGGASARAAFPLPSSSYFLSFAWRDEDTKIRAGRILEACGPKLGELGKQNNRVLLSLAYVLDGLWDGFDFERDVLPVVERKTGPGRKDALWDFALLTENIEVKQEKRLRDEARAAAHAAKMADVARPSAAKAGGRGKGGGPSPAPVADARKRADRIAWLQRFLADMDASNSESTGRLDAWRFLLNPRDRQLNDHWLFDAMSAVAAEKRAELQRLLAEDGNGGGDGEAR